jgi:beta-N-acetylhexosaminidase
MRPKSAGQSSLFGVLLAAVLTALLACGQGADRAANEEAERSDPSLLPQASAPVRPGLDVLLTDSINLVDGLRVGLITNHTGVDAEGVHGIDRLMESPQIELVALYSPEHGIRGETEGGLEIDTGVDERTGLPIHSLYGATLKPTPAMLEGIDVLLFDIQDIGARFYTYVSTMAKAMEAAGEEGIPFVVLDRPNPIGGEAVQGTVLDPAFATFVGLFPIPTRHGMTPGELAGLFAGEFGIEVDLTVVPAEGWRRNMRFEDTNLPWIPPSPNMPSIESALHYPGTCLFEGTNLSEGRGTDIPFQIVGAPWLDGEVLAAALEGYGIPGVDIQPYTFTPREPRGRKFVDQEIQGVRLAVSSSEYDPTLMAVALLVETYRMSGDRWEWREGHFDRLAGTNRLREGILAGLDVPALREGWDQELQAFRELRAPYLLYP